MRDADASLLNFDWIKTGKITRDPHVTTGVGHLRVVQTTACRGTKEDPAPITGRGYRPVGIVCDIKGATTSKTIVVDRREDHFLTVQTFGNDLTAESRLERGTVHLDHHARIDRQSCI